MVFALPNPPPYIFPYSLLYSINEMPIMKQFVYLNNLLKKKSVQIPVVGCSGALDCYYSLLKIIKHSCPIFIHWEHIQRPSWVAKSYQYQKRQENTIIFIYKIRNWEMKVNNGNKKRMWEGHTSIHI